jgi:hypothetical protein
MLRGFDNFNRWAMIEEPRCTARTRLAPHAHTHTHARAHTHPHTHMRAHARTAAG